MPLNSDLALSVGSKIFYEIDPLTYIGYHVLLPRSYLKSLSKQTDS
jgi:hypothetical protein